MGDESSVRVAVRIRPQIARELIEMCRVCTSVTPGEPQVWLGSDKAFTYDYVYDMATTQHEVYDTCVEGLIEGCFEGYNATVLAYGQTGSGKTYTMGTGLEVDSKEDVVGIIPRAVEHLFRGIDERREAAKVAETTPPDFKITAHFMELYNEEIIDLFEPDFRGTGKGGVRIHEDAGGGIYVTGISTRNVTSLEETMQCLRAGALSRTTASTNMNTQSSRSHAIFTLLVKQQRLSPIQDPENPEDVPEFETLTAKFHFVDLAGSERLKRTGATGERAREGISINCGLLALGNVISALGDISKKASHVPYRDSKLTRLLQDSLGGNSRTLMIACVSPSDTDFMETLNTLKYANRARNIKNKVTVNQDKASKAIAILRQEIQQLRIELMEYKQGKRIIGEDGCEAVNDMFHENQMLVSDSNNLRNRIKAMQETIEMLTTKNTALLAEKETSGWISCEENDMATVIQGYLKEIEDLRAKLCESENICQQLRKQLNNHANRPARLSGSPLHVPMTGSMFGAVDEPTQSFAELIEEAKRDLSKDLQVMERKKRISEGSGSAEDEENEEEEGGGEEENEEDVDSSDESGEDKDDDEEEDDDSEVEESRETYTEELAEITSEISIKQKLIEGLEQSQRRLEIMKSQYEEKLNVLMNRIRATQDERDKVLSNIKCGSSQSDEKVKSIKQGYEKKIGNMQQELKKLQVAQKEHTKLMRERTQHERQLRTLKGDLAEMKKVKVKLMNKMKEDNNRMKQEHLKKNKEIAQLRKASRKQENYIKSLEADNRLKNVVLKRKTEEIAVLKRVPKQGLSSKAAGRLRKRAGGGPMASFSPKVVKNKWQNLEQSINKMAYNKQTVSSMERDMERWLKERESLSRQLERVMRKRERSDPADITSYNDMNDQVEALKANIDYIHENIRECQENIMSMEESKEISELLHTDNVTSGLGLDESHYLINKLISMTVNQATVSAQRQAEISELEGKMKQYEQTTSVQEQLLAHVLGDKDMEVYSLMSSLVAAEDNTPASTESSRSNSPTDGLMESSATSLVFSSDSLKRRDKARRKTATTEDMLFTNGSEKNGNASGTDASANTTPLGTIVGATPIVALERLAAERANSDRLAPDRMTKSFIVDRMTSSLEGTLGDDGLLMPPPSTSHRAVPRVTSAPNPLKNLMSYRADKSSPILSRKNYERQDSTSPRLGRRSLTSLSTSNLNYSRQSSVDNNPEMTPPTSPTTYRRSTSREENVFSRLTSTTSSTRDSRPDTGVINPHAGRVSQRSVLACTHVAQGHSKAVLSVYATDDLLFSASKDRTVKMWDLVRGQEIQSLGGHPNNVNCVRYCEATRTCFSVSSSFIKVWDIRENPAKCNKMLTSAGLASTGVTQINSQSRTLQMPPGETLITDVAISTSTNILYSAAGNIVRIWDLRKHTAVGKLAGGHQAAVMCLAVDSTIPGQDVVATGSKDHYIKVFDVATSNSGLVNPRLNLDPPHYDGIQSLALYGDTLFSGSRDMCIKKWDLQRGEHVLSLNNAHKDWVCALCFTPGGQIVLSGCRGGIIKMWSAESCQLIGELRAHASPINAITTNSTCIFTASNDCTIGMWRMRTSYDVSPELSDAS